VPLVLAAEGTSASQAARPRKLAALAFVYGSYRTGLHAFAILGKYLNGYNAFVKKGHKDYFVSRKDAGDGCQQYPRSQIASLYVEQVPEHDFSHEISRKHQIPICRTVDEALTFGTNELAVDGVLIIGEHGDFPTNDKGQKLYPGLRCFSKLLTRFVRPEGLYRF
jgi:hypothetical protein